MTQWHIIAFQCIMALYILQFVILESSQAWCNVLNNRLNGLIQVDALVGCLQFAKLQITNYNHNSPTCFDSWIAMILEQLIKSSNH